MASTSTPPLTQSTRHWTIRPAPNKRERTEHTVITEDDCSGASGRFFRFQDKKNVFIKYDPLANTTEQGRPTCKCPVVYIQQQRQKPQKMQQVSELRQFIGQEVELRFKAEGKGQFLFWKLRICCVPSGRGVPSPAPSSLSATPSPGRRRVVLHPCVLSRLINSACCVERFPIVKAKVPLSPHPQLLPTQVQVRVNSSASSNVRSTSRGSQNGEAGSAGTRA